MKNEQGIEIIEEEIDGVTEIAGYLLYPRISKEWALYIASKIWPQATPERFIDGVYDGHRTWRVSTPSKIQPADIYGQAPYSEILYEDIWLERIRDRYNLEIILLGYGPRLKTLIHAYSKHMKLNKEEERWMIRF